MKSLVSTSHVIIDLQHQASLAQELMCQHQTMHKSDKYLAPVANDLSRQQAF